MRTPRRFTSPWQMAMSAALFLALIQAGMLEGQAQTAQGEPKAHLLAAKPITRPTKPLDVSVDQVRVSQQQEETEVRVEGSGRLYCVPFLLGRPDRLVLDFPGTAMRVQRPVILGDVRPVRSVRFSQFKAYVARLVIDLDEQTPYLLIVRENFVTVVFNSSAVAVSPPTRDAKNPAFVEASAAVTPVAVAKEEKKSSGIDFPAPWRSKPPVPDQAQRGIERNSSLGLPAPSAPLPSSSLAHVPTPASSSSAEPLPTCAGSPASASSSTLSQSSAPHAQDGARTVSSESDTSASPVAPPSSNQDSDRPALKPRWRYRILPGDVLELTFIFTPEFDQVVNVQPDGYVTLKAVGSLRAQGQTTAEFTQALVAAYGKILRDPIITVNLNDFVKPYFTVGGQVEKPGKFELHGETTVTEAVAMAGGFKDAAKHSQVLLVRKVSDQWAEVKVVNVKHMVNAKDFVEDVYLQPGDMLYVPKNFISKINRFIPVPATYFDIGRYIY